MPQSKPMDEPWMNIQGEEEVDGEFELISSDRVTTEVYYTQADVDAARAARLARIRPDNQAFADAINDQIARAVPPLLPLVNAAVVAFYESMGFAATRQALEKDPMSAGAYMLYDKCRDKYTLWTVSRRWFFEWMECGGIEHPSQSITNSLRDELIDRGFDGNEGYWEDLRGARISLFEWFDRPYLSGRLAKPSHQVVPWPSNYIVDPVGMQEIHDRFRAAFNELEAEAKQTRECYERARVEGATAFKAGLQLSDCPHEAGTVAHYGWSEPWGKNITWGTQVAEGKLAYRNGQQLSDCPYADGAFESQNWCAGWESANDEAHGRDIWR